MEPEVVIRHHGAGVWIGVHGDVTPCVADAVMRAVATAEQCSDCVHIDLTAVEPGSPAARRVELACRRFAATKPERVRIIAGATP